MRDEKIRLMNISKAINKRIGENRNKNWWKILKELRPNNNSVWRVAKQFKKSFF